MKIVRSTIQCKAVETVFTVYTLFLKNLGSTTEEESVGFGRANCKILPFELFNFFHRTSQAGRSAEGDSKTPILPTELSPSPSELHPGFGQAQN